MLLAAGQLIAVGDAEADELVVLDMVLDVFVEVLVIELVDMAEPVALAVVVLVAVFDELEMVDDETTSLAPETPLVTGDPKLDFR